MYICPVCHQSSISFWAKWRSGAWLPIICEKCSAKVHLNSTVNGLLGVVSYFGFLYSAYLAFNQWSWIPLIVFVVIWSVLMAVIVKFAPLVPK